MIAHASSSSITTKISPVERRVRAYLEGLKLPDGITRYVSQKRLTRTDQRLLVAMFILETVLSTDGTMGVVGAARAKRTIVSREEVLEMSTKARLPGVLNGNPVTFPRAPWKLTGSDVTQALEDLVNAGEVKRAGILFVFEASA